MRWLLLAALCACDPPVERAEPAAEAPEAQPEAEPEAEPEAGAVRSPTVLAEARLLGRMRDGLESGDVDDAWDAVVDHEQRFPEGELWPDREVFAVAILVRQGETHEARLRAEIFLETHDQCAHGQRVRVLIAGIR